MALALIPFSMNSLFEQIILPENLQTAWQTVKTKGSAGGIDKVSIEMFDQKAGEYLQILHQQLTDNYYIPEPYKTLFIPKNDNEFRKLGLPCVKDKIIQTATKHIIEPLFEKEFLNISYAYRAEKGPVKAINRIQNRILAEHRNWVLLADIDNYFDTINPEILYNLLEPKIDCEPLMKLIKLWVQIGTINFSFNYQKYKEGIPQGCILSPLLSNIYLHPFDKFMVEKGYGLVRYADDFIILEKNYEQALNAYKHAKIFLENELKLHLNSDWKIKKTYNGFEFLHICFEAGKTTITGDRLKHLHQKIENSIQNTNGIPDILKLHQTINGIRSFYGRIVPDQILLKIDQIWVETLSRKLSHAVNATKKCKSEQAIAFLQELHFISNQYNNQRGEITRQIIERLKSGKYKSQDPVAIKQAVIAPTKPPNPKKHSGTDKAPLTLEKAIEQKRKQYEQLADAGRELVIASPGMFIGKTQRIITVKEKGQNKLTMPIQNLQSITILAQGVSLSSNVIQFCAAQQIPIHFLGFDGLPYAKLFTPIYPDASLGLAQIKALENGLGMSLMKNMITGKLKNQLYLIKYYYKYRKDKDADYAEAFMHHTESIANAIVKINLCKETNIDIARNSIMGYEGHSAACYWDMVIRLLNNYTAFETRQHQGATDLVNCLLNYGYGILYSRVWDAIIREQLNPNISYIHALQPNKPTLAFDLIEEFRQQAVDKVVFSLITKSEEMKVEKGLLTQETKKRLTEKILERLNNKEIFRKSEYRLIEIIRHQAHALKLHLAGEKTYKPYIAKW